MMAVESEKTSSSDCNLSTKVLKTGSKNYHSLNLYCHFQISYSETTVAIIISGFCTVIPGESG